MTRFKKREKKSFFFFLMNVCLAIVTEVINIIGISLKRKKKSQMNRFLSTSNTRMFFIHVFISVSFILDVHFFVVAE